MNRKPVILVTGFLGSGKTTFLNWLIQKAPDKKISLILNEFGDIKLESQFIKQRSGEVIELANGCMCCVAKKDVPHIIQYICENSPQTEYIVIEASGLSDPDPIMETLQGPELADLIQLESLICVVDALNFQQTRVDHPIVMSQAGDSDLIVLSKVSEAGADKVTAIKNDLHGMFSRTKVIEFTNTLSPWLFLDNVSFEHLHQVISGEQEHHHEHEQFDTIWLKTDTVLNQVAFQKFMQTLPTSVLRSKGVVALRQADGTVVKMLVQYIGARLQFMQSTWQEGEKQGSAMLFIGTGIDNDALEKGFQACAS